MSIDAETLAEALAMVEARKQAAEVKLPAPKVLRPAEMSEELVGRQEGIPTGTILDRLFRRGGYALGGIPEGALTLLAGPPGCGKTRTLMFTALMTAARGHKVLLVLSEEPFGQTNPARMSFAQRLAEMGELMGDGPRLHQILRNIAVWDEPARGAMPFATFLGQYAQLLRTELPVVVLFDSINGIDPSRGALPHQLASIKRLHNERGTTALACAQLASDGDIAGSLPALHAAEAVVLLERVKMTSKEEAAVWNSSYKAEILTARALKSLTSDTHRSSVRVEQAYALGGAIDLDPKHPIDLLPVPVIE